MDEKHLTPSFGALQDEHTTLPPQEDKKPTTVGQRFSGFAMCHLTFSILLAVTFPVWSELFAYSDAKLIPLAGISLMGAYFPLGYFWAALEEWTIPQSPREKYLAVAYPMAVAWAWVVVVLFSLCTAVFTQGALLVVAVPVSFFLAAPSSAVVLMFADQWAYGPMGEAFIGLALIGLIAGFLPPLFFALGSFWQASWAEKKKEKRTAEA